MKKGIVCAALLCLLLCACANTLPDESPAPATPAVTELPEATETPAAPTPEPEPPLPEGLIIAPDSESVSLDAAGPDAIDALCLASGRLGALRAVTISGAAVAPAQLAQLQAAFPEAVIRCRVSTPWGEFDSEEQELDLSEAPPDSLDAESVAALAAVLPSLQELRLYEPEGQADPDRLTLLSELRAALPSAVSLRCSFTLFGRHLSSETEEAIYEKAGLQSGELERVRMALSLMPACRRFVLDNCGPSYAELAALRDDFPDSGVVWRVHFGPDSLLTDATVLWSDYLTDENCHVLDYCSQLQYIDVGHDEDLTDISFVRFMPQLKVLIVALTGVSDLDPLRSCPELEYLEVFTTQVSDLGPLADCTALEHLNISNLKDLDDLTPLYGLKKLQRLRICMCDRITEEQIAALAEQLPDCQLILGGKNPTGYGWRFLNERRMAPRYQLLRQQIGYGHCEVPRQRLEPEHSWQPGFA